jgi:hypothetical protein
MIQRTRRPEPNLQAIDASEPAAHKLVELTDLDFGLGPEWVLTFTLGPDDTMEPTDTHFVIRLAVNQEVIEIERARVVWRSSRVRTIAMPVSLDPADAPPA